MQVIENLTQTGFNNCQFIKSYDKKNWDKVVLVTHWLNIIKDSHSSLSALRFYLSATFLIVAEQLQQLQASGP